MLNTFSCHDLVEFGFFPSNYNILVVEDSRSINKILTTTFQKAGYNCFSTYTLAEAKQILESNTIHYVLLDIHLPDGNGYEIIKILEKTDVRVIVITSEKDKEFHDSVYQKGILDFIIKDVDFLYQVEQVISFLENLEKNRLKTILVIDDSIVIQRQLKDILEKRNYSIELADDESSALEIINSKKIDMILLDIELKSSNGIELLKKNRNNIIIKKNIPVMIISGNIETSTMRDSLKAGAVDILKKPYIIEEVILKVDLWIDYKRKKDEVKCSTTLLSEYKDVVDESAIVSKTNSKGVITFVNDNFCQISGYTKEELEGQKHNIIRDPSMPIEVFEDMWYTIKILKITWNGKLRNIKKDGTFYWVDALVKPILDNNGNIIEFISLRTDITEIESYKELLHDKLNDTNKSLDEHVNHTIQYEEAIDTFTAILKTDSNNLITFINEEFSKLSGFTLEELVGVNYDSITHKSYVSSSNSHLFSKIQTQKEYMSYTLTNIAKDGSLYYVDTIAYPITDLEGKVTEHLYLMHDVTELSTLHKEIEETQKEIIYKMGEIGESRSNETGNHVKRVAEYSKKLALLYGFAKREAEILFKASPMHDIGKVAIADNILKKTDSLTDEEFQIMKTHTTIGYDVLKGSSREILKAASVVAHEHHEKWNGTGYPRGIKGDDIHIYGRITAIVDVFDALGSIRCYKDAWNDVDIFKFIQEESGEYFDPKLVSLFLDNKEDFLNIREKYQD